jgi:hypothetical protein
MYVAQNWATIQCYIKKTIMVQVLAHHLPPTCSPFLWWTIMWPNSTTNNNTSTTPTIALDINANNNIKHLGGIFSVKFGIYMHQTTIFKRVLNNCSTYFVSPYYYFLIDTYESHPTLIIIHYFISLHTLYYN